MAKRSIGKNLDEWEKQPLEERFEVWDTIDICGKEVTFYKPTTQMILSLIGRISTVENIQDALSVLGHVIEREDYHHVLRSMHSGALDADVLLEEVMYPLMEEVLESPTTAASASSLRAPRTGTSSMGGARPGTSTRQRSRRVEPSA